MQTEKVLLGVVPASAGFALGVVSWLQLAYATATLLLSDLSRSGGVMYGSFFVLEVGAVVWALASQRHLPRRQLVTAAGIAGWLCALATLIFVNVFHATL